MAAKTPRRTPAKQVRLRLVYIDYWSALKMSALVGFSLAIVQMVASLLLYGVMSISGLLGKISSLTSDIAGGAIDTSFLTSLPTTVAFIGISGLLLFITTSALGAVIAVLYNIAARITGGILVGYANE